MPTYKRPDVYVEEISTLPPSVAEVSTAIPAFFGYTEKAQREGEDLTGQPTRISTMLDYETWFGKAKPTEFTVTVDASDKITEISPPELKHLMYYALRMYFDNGGGSCYIVSLGSYGKTAAGKEDFRKGIEALKKEDEPTLIVLTDAVNLSEADYYELCQLALKQCNNLKDRFAIFDNLKDDANGANFRQEIGTENLQYGAVYYPYLQTSLNYYYTNNSVRVNLKPSGEESGDETTVEHKLNDDEIKKQKTVLYNAIKAELDKKRVILPPSAAVAGVYAKVDRERGVWKSPANVSLASVISPIVKITNEEQDDLNIDPTGGKSINAIRSFTGRGTLIWGARTLAGNDNEWRYISVRRFFNLIEESIQKATAFVVFESNNAITWLKVKTMIESYLEGLWRQGALAGTTAEQAYFVAVGLGKTMTEQDILEGRMIIKIGVAAVRPAEFVILQFSHKLQEA